MIVSRMRIGVSFESWSAHPVFVVRIFIASQPTRRALLLRPLSWRFREVAVSGLNDQVTVVDAIDHGHPVGRDMDQGAFAEILGQPLRAAYGRGGVVTVGREVAVTFSPQFAHHMPTRRVL